MTIDPEQPEGYRPARHRAVTVRSSGRRRGDIRRSPERGVSGGASIRGPGAADRPDRTGHPPPRLVGWDVYADWEAVYRDNVDRVYRLMYARVGNRSDAEDLTTDVFLAALRPLRVSASVGEVRAYLLATARTALAAHWRRTLGRPITTLDEQHLELAPTVAEPGSAARARVEQIFAALTERHRRILELRFLRSCSLKEAAAELGVTVANAKVLQHRALRHACRVAERMDPRAGVP